ncbi:DUF1707 SHOCT-like domain-containing protein [Sphaerisporangium fuscum]|uniref:DUF1707 SHOCT-like domain-containing protein n=1 Tax=Sphaerisporangium fuscum TaxID=2835868 RepID=UPI001BDCFDFF|nr:DUF1707 domain-containing protein [Sphaerisporangium fuscum]
MNDARAHVRDGDRDRAVDRIQEAYADGRLSPAELERRLELALTATSSGELTPAVADLPDEDDVVELRSTGGHITRTGDWRVPRLLRIDSEYGKVRLDLSRCAVRHPRIDIELVLTYGSAIIILPAGASANVDGARSQWGGITCTAPGDPRPGKPHIRVTGDLAYGRLKIRNARR